MSYLIPAAETIPNPYIPLNVRIDAEWRDVGVTKNRIRRAEIFANARKLLSSRSFDHFSVKALANVCVLSTQSIHAKLGDKLTIIANATNDYTEALFAQATREQEGLSKFLTFIQLILKSCEVVPDFYPSIVANSAHYGSGDIIFQKTHIFGSALIEKMLYEAQRSDVLDSRADVPVVANSISILLSHSILECTRCGASGDELYQIAFQRIGVLLLGAVRSERIGYVRNSLKECGDSRHRLAGC